MDSLSTEIVLTGLLLEASDNDAVNIEFSIIEAIFDECYSLEKTTNTQKFIKCWLILRMYSTVNT